MLSTLNINISKKYQNVTISAKECYKTNSYHIVCCAVLLMLRPAVGYIERRKTALENKETPTCTQQNFLLLRLFVRCIR